MILKIASRKPKPYLLTLSIIRTIFPELYFEAARGRYSFYGITAWLSMDLRLQEQFVRDFPDCVFDDAIIIDCDVFNKKYQEP